MFHSFEFEDWVEDELYVEINIYNGWMLDMGRVRNSLKFMPSVVVLESRLVSLISTHSED